MRLSSLRPRRIGREALLLALVAVVVIPFYMIAVNSFKDVNEAARFRLTLPSDWRFDNFKEVFSGGKIVKGYFNSALISLGALVVTNLFASLASYSIQRNNNRLTNFLYYFFIVGLVMPVSLVPTIKLLMGLGIHNTYQGMILYYSAVLLPFTIFLMTGYMKTLPRELDESGIIDGCGPLRLFFSIALPLMQPVIVTASLLTIVSVWNDFMGPFYLLTDGDKWTVTVSVYNYVGRYSSDWNLIFADILVVILPVLILYFLLQEYIVEGMTAGAMKG
ncbi:carbohydrate ABC transporter permease [Cohnella thailandensis]|uniref:Carbohydrate ABC transporter permease n=1 Tax=Cohnella thailandensis TaxID=557557 RepID=A0A841SXR7_9BACL|nr:carbohydrate ABC transporter permease [Cohnella thailandensis]MBB6636062.1 carbohydrate ABC transporter permease [Cohnella thailandensis]MBP1976783.1 raffinose/stachyose/melibiose transport system permease protein [Cohnella thailandensis]